MPDTEFLKGVPFYCLIPDEAKSIKNPLSQRFALRHFLIYLDNGRLKQVN